MDEQEFLNESLEELDFNADVARRNIDGLSAALVRNSEANALASQGVEVSSRRVSSQVSKAFTDLVRDGDKLSDVLRNLGLSIADTTFQAAIKPVATQIGGGISTIINSLLSFTGNGAASPVSAAPFVEAVTATPLRAAPFNESGVGSVVQAAPFANAAGFSPSKVSTLADVADPGPSVVSPLAGFGDFRAIKPAPLAQVGDSDSVKVSAFSDYGDFGKADVAPFIDTGLVGPTQVTPFADIGDFSQARVTPFAKGGGVGIPVAAPVRSGAGLMDSAVPGSFVPASSGGDVRHGGRSVGGSGGQAVNIVMNISTPDAVSFQRSQSQIAAQMSRALSRGQRNR